jgi:hypothetical protein
MDALIPDEIIRPIKRKHGGQPGNRNAFRHGFYAKNFTREELTSLDKNIKGDYQDELALARVLTAHLAELLKDYRELPFEKFLAGCVVLNQLIARVNSLTRSYHILYKNGSTTAEVMNEIMEELGKIPPEIDYLTREEVENQMKRLSETLENWDEEKMEAIRSSLDPQY